MRTILLQTLGPSDYPPPHAVTQKLQWWVSSKGGQVFRHQVTGGDSRPNMTMILAIDGLQTCTSGYGIINILYCPLRVVRAGPFCGPWCGEGWATTQY